MASLNLRKWDVVEQAIGRSLRGDIGKVAEQLIAEAEGDVFGEEEEEMEDEPMAEPEETVPPEEGSDADVPTVTVEVHDGYASVSNKSAGVVVEVIDYINVDEEGNPTTEVYDAESVLPEPEAEEDEMGGEEEVTDTGPEENGFEEDESFSEEDY
jgi:hypothetical protein